MRQQLLLYVGRYRPGIFKESTLYTKLIHKTLNIRDPRPIHDGYETKLPYVTVADEAFSIMENLMRLFIGKLLSREKDL